MFVKTNWRLVVGAVFVFALGVGFGMAPVHHFPVPKPDPNPPAPPKPDWFGWHGPDATQKALAASLPTLSRAAPQLLGVRDADDTRPILLYRAWTDLFSDYPPYKAQEIGDCVSFGHGHANDLLQCIEWCLNHPGRPPIARDIQETDTEFLYGESRKVAGILGRQDGSYGAAAVKAMTTVGLVSRRMLGDQGAYSGRRAKAWGLSGPPASVESMAGRFKLGDAARVTTWEELVAALHSGHPVTICTGQGFTLVRDPQGFCRPHGRWGHCMFIAGIRFDRPGACIVQSWGPEMPSGPRALDQPPFSFWADRDVVERILAEGDSWALSAAPHFGAGRAKGRRRMPEGWRKAA